MQFVSSDLILHNNSFKAYEAFNLHKVIINKIINRKMKMHIVMTYLKTSVIMALLCCQVMTMAEDSQPVVFKIDIKSEIMPGTARSFSKALNQAAGLKANAILIHMNTYGGILDAADSIRTGILNSSIPCIVFIDNNAASAGALISIACNKIYMRSGASIGAATVVDQQAKPLPDKYQSYMRSMMRSTAEKRGRDPKIAEAMVDPRTYIPGVNDSGKVLTFTAKEALKNGYCNGICESIEEVLKSENLADAKIYEYKPTPLDKFINWLIHPAISGILILIIIGGIYFELQTPGIGFPLLAAAIAALLYFAPLYLEGLASHWEVLLIIAGFVLIALEIFVFPGFGVAGISGIVLIILGFVLTLLPNQGFDFTFTPDESILESMLTVVISISLAILMMFVFGGRLLKSKLFGKLVLQETLSSQEGYVSTLGSDGLSIGAHATAYTDLRPSGKIIINGNVFTAVAESHFISKGTTVKITGIDGNRITVTDLL
jgi:membrane-bound serine protease (ClpP class)